MKRYALLSALLIFAFITFVTVSPIEFRPPDIFDTDIDRALAFALLGAACTAARPRAWAAILALLIAVAGGLELLQLLFESRHAQLYDAVVKAAGAGAGVLAMVVVWQYRRRTRENRSRSGAVVFRMPRTPQPVDIPVASRAIRSVHFNPGDGRLRIRFTNGETRLFDGLQDSDVEAFVNAPSPGQHYVETIRGRFRRLAA